MTYQQAFSQLGQSWDVSTELFQKLQEITCHMCLLPKPVMSMNCDIKCDAKRGEVEFCQLPPCEDCLFMHVLHANHQTAIWRCSLQSQVFVSSPVGCGWTTDNDGKLAIECMHGSAAPDAVLQLLSCMCTCSCKLPECTCLANNMKYTDMCKLQKCNNQPVEEPSPILEDSDTDEEDYELENQ